MKIALVGTGQMGRAVASLAPDRGHTVCARFDSASPLTALPVDASADVVAEALHGADALIDFSLPSVIHDHLDRYCAWGVPAVVGTTGWYDTLDDVAASVEAHAASLLYAPNFSIGVAVMRRAVEAVTPLMNALDDYDAFVHEVHHKRKVDSPSGTAGMLAQVVLDGLDRKDHVDAEAQHDRIDPSALHVSSTRVGEVFGEHTVGFDSAFDRVEMAHRAKSRDGFAFGALRAAEWLQGRTGLFTLDDILDDWLSGSD